MSNARATILARVADAQRTARLPVVEPPRDVDDSRVVQSRGSQDTPHLVLRFQQELSLVGVEVQALESAADVRAWVQRFVAGRRVLSWDPALLPYEAGTVLGNVTLGSSSRDEQAQAEIGVTGCDGAVAETGSLALLSSAGRSRAVSLLPPTHLAIVNPAQLFATMADFFRERGDALGSAAACTFITGPSRTADIELTLTLGIHGPGRVVVVIGP